MLPVSWETVRLFLHVLAATVWVGGQLTLAGLVPGARALDPTLPKALARRFMLLAWPAFGVLFVTGLWNIAAVGSSHHGDTAWSVTLLVKLLVIALSGVSRVCAPAGEGHRRARGLRRVDRRLGDRRGCGWASCSPLDGDSLAGGTGGRRELQDEGDGIDHRGNKVQACTTNSWRCRRTSCGHAPERCATVRTAPASPTPPRCSSRSRCSAGIVAATAPSPSLPHGSITRTSRPSRCSRSPAAAPRTAATRPCSRLGERPEERYPVAREWLDEHGYASTVHYVEAMARLVRDETGLLPHGNAGALDADELAPLRVVAPSQGMMVESLNADLAAHRGSPDKTPARRLATLEAAGELAIPFTTGILVGIGESRQDRIDALEAIAASHAATGTCRRSSSRTSCPSRAPRCTVRRRAPRTTSSTRSPWRG